ncbi:hypothetical protein ACOME3_008898 [Neoechinorhynchus agilis]
MGLSFPKASSKDRNYKAHQSSNENAMSPNAFNDEEYFDARSYLPRLKYFAVRPALDNIEPEKCIFDNQREATERMRNQRGSRMKIFDNYDEALHYVKSNPDTTILNASKTDYKSTRQKSKERVFFAPTRNYCSVSQVRLNQFAYYIQNGDIEAVRKAIDSNPYYLVTDHDTPTVMQVACRYNAAHICSRAVKSSREAAQILQIILNAVSSFTFMVRISVSDVMPAKRCQQLLDQYLNNCERLQGDAPIHIAARLGNTDVITVLLGQPLCNANRLNSIGLKAIHLIPEIGANNKSPTEIRNAFDGSFYIVAIETEEVGPVILLEPIMSSDLCGSTFKKFRRQLVALAGPMTKKVANYIFNRYKRQKFVNNSFRSASFAGTPYESRKYLRKQARKHCVPIRERFPFYDSLIDLQSPEGLNIFEAYLKQIYIRHNAPRLWAMIMSRILKNREHFIASRLSSAFNSLIEYHGSECTIDEDLAAELHSLCHTTSFLKYILHRCNPNETKKCCHQYFNPSFNDNKFDELCIMMDFTHISKRFGCLDGSLYGPSIFEPGALEYDVYQALDSVEVSSTAHPFIRLWMREMVDGIEYEPSVSDGQNFLNALYEQAESELQTNVLNDVVYVLKIVINKVCMFESC